MLDATTAVLRLSLRPVLSKKLFEKRENPNHLDFHAPDLRGNVDSH
jgi:hypothetical protein